MNRIFSKPLIFSEGKNPPKNEDSVGSNETTLVLSDGATDVTGQKFDGKTGGEITSKLVVETCLSSDLNGVELVSEITRRLGELYEQINPRAIDDSKYRFASSLICVRIVGDELLITQVGDSLLRINCSDVYENNKLIDHLTANARKEYIAVTQDVAGSRDFILPLLQAQHTYQNNSDYALSYGVIDGTPIPEQFIKTYTIPTDDTSTVELVSDGYYGEFPDVAEIDAYEELYRHIEAVDPDKCDKFPAVKTSDDRTVMISKIESLK
ncbi:MAG: hypothetical protein L0H38_03445 [bacterium]|nr:hypothetical protein [bacterium]